MVEREALLARIEVLERRVAALEERRKPQTSAPPPAPRARFDLETVVGLTWFNLGGAAISIAGLAMLAVWANERGYLSSLVRNAGAAAIALLVLAAGARLLASPSRGRRHFGTGVAILGGASLYVVPLSASRIDALISSSTSTALMLVVTGVIAALAYRRRSFGLALVAFAGGLGIPLHVAAAGAGGFAQLFGYLALIIPLFIWLQHARGWVALDALGGLAAAAYYVAWLAQIDGGSHGALLVGLAMWAAAIVYVATRDRDAGGEIVLQIGLLAVGVSAFAGGFIAGSGTGGPAAVSLMIAVHVHLARLPDRITSLAILLVAVTIAPVVFESRLAATVATLAFAVPLLVACLRGSRIRLADSALLVAAAASFAIAWIGIALRVASLDQAAMAIAALATAAVGLAVALFVRGSDRKALSMVVSIAGVAAATAAIVHFFGLAPGNRALATSVSLVASGFALVVAGVWATLHPPRIVGLLLIGAAVGKTLLIDIWSLPIGARVGACLAIGAGLLAASFMYGRLTDKAS